MSPALTSATDHLICPACRWKLAGASCLGCGRAFPRVAGLPDLRLASDRFLGLAGERAKAERLARIAPSVDLAGLARAYYAMTPDVDARRRRSYLGHILGAEGRGSALAALLPRTGRIVEVGCGTGGLLAAAARSGRTIEGVDIASRWLVVARRRLDDHGLTVPLIAASADRLPYGTGTVDAIVVDSLLEHLDDPAAAVREWARVLRPGGTLLAWSPNRFSVAVDPHVRLWLLGYLPRSWMPAYVRWRRGAAWPPACLSAREAGRLAAGAGFEDIEVEAPAIPGGWAEGHSRALRVVIAAYGAARRFGPSRTLLRSIGPLWQIRATRGEG